MENMYQIEKTLAKYDFLGFYVIPNLATTFILSNCITGLLKYNYPEWEFLDDLKELKKLPIFVTIFKRKS